MVSLIGELFRGTLSDESALRPQLDAMLHKTHLLMSLGQMLDDSLVTIAMVIPLPPSYSTLCTILMLLDTTLTTNKVTVSVIEHEEMMQSEAKHTTLAARMGKPGTPQSSKSSDKMNKDKSSKQCAYCKKPNHTKDECHKCKVDLEAAAEKKKADAKLDDLNAKVAHTAHTEPDEPVLRVYVADTLKANAHSLASRWIVDSGASAHMSSSRAHFQMYCKLAAPCRVWLGNDRFILTIGKGAMYLEPDGYNTLLLLSHVFHVPDLHSNLLSVSQLTAKCCNIEFIHDGCHFIDTRDKHIVGNSLHPKQPFHIQFLSMCMLLHLTPSPPLAILDQRRQTSPRSSQTNPRPRWTLGTTASPI